MYNSDWCSSFGNYLLKSLILCLYIPYGSLHAGDQQEAIWVKYKAPPAYITEGPYTNQGMSDQIFRFIQGQLPQFSHSEELANVSRIIKEMQRGRTICTHMLRTPEREAFAYYSIPALLHTTHRIYYLPDNYAFQSAVTTLAENGFISLELLLRDYPQFTLGLVRQRSYSNEKDRIFERYQEQITYRTGNDDALGLLNMLKKYRIDYIIEYPTIISYVHANAQQTSVLDSIGISESATNFFGHIACTKTPLGKQIISAINQVLLEHRNTPEYLSNIEKWLDKSVLQTYRADYQNLMNTIE